MSEWDAFPVAGGTERINPSEPRSPLRVEVTPTQPGYADAISGIESGGNYRAIGPATRTGDRAFGKYQVMGANIGPWTKEALGRELTRQEFLTSPEAQDAVFNHRFGQYAQKYGPEGAARAWFAGEGGMNDPNRRDILGTSVADYSRKFTAGMNKAQGPAQITQSESVGQLAGGSEWDAFPAVSLPAPQAAPPQPAEGAGQSRPPADDVGRFTALLRGASSGATFNFPDEIAGALNTADFMGGRQGQMAGPVDAVKGLAQLGYELLTGSPGEATKAYEQARDVARGEIKTAKEQYPGTTLAGELAGAVAVPIPGAAALRGATMGGRALGSAAIGAGAGALAGAGEGEDLASRASGAATGGVVGGLVGGAASPVLDKAAKVGGRVFEEAGRYLFPSADARAVKMLQGAKASAEKVDPAAETRLTGQQVAGTPGAAVVDMLGDPGRGIARWAANASPEARTVLNRMIGPRFEGQTARITGWLDNTFHYPNAAAQREALEQAQKSANSVNYKRAMQQGEGGLWSPELERLAGSDAVSGAMQRASKAWKDEAVVSGQGAMNPRVTFTEDGRMQIARGPTGVPTYPDLQYWDLVRRELSGAAETVGKTTPEGRRLSVFANKMNEELDRLVPSYQQARQGHAYFAGAKDALEAGENFVRMKGQNDEARRLMAKMSPTERQLFQDGFVSKYISSLKETGDTRNVLNKIAESPGSKERLNMVLGPQKANELEAMLRVEGVMDLTRAEVRGNSTTARQLIEAGAVGASGGLGAYYQGIADPGNLAQTLILGAFVKRGRTTDQRVAQKVAEMLISRDPAVMQKGLKIISRNQGFMDAIRSLDKQIARISGQQGSGVPALQSMGTGRAEDQQ